LTLSRPWRPPSLSLPHSKGKLFSLVRFFGPRKWLAANMPAATSAASAKSRNIGV
jgi:hypothetical protein